MAFTYISGATGGIGKAFSLECAKKGYNLYLTGRSQEKLTALKNQLESEYKVQILTFPCDLTSEIERAQMIDNIERENLSFDRIILVAGVDTQKPFMDYTQQKILFQLEVNCIATISLAHSLLKRREKSAQVIVISSMSGATPMPYFALYSASKAMLTNFFSSLHYELKKDGVKVTVVMPGGVPTRPDVIEQIKGQGLWGFLSQKSPEFVARKSLEKVKKNKLKYIPGAFNKLLYFGIKLLPEKLVLKIVARRWKNISKDAF